MNSQSILFINNNEIQNLISNEEPEFFADLNLNQIIDTITESKKSYDLCPFFYTPLKDLNTIKFRQDVFKDLEDQQLVKELLSFAEKMVDMHRYLGMVENLNYKYQKEGWFLEAVETYCEAVSSLAHDLSLANLKSTSLIAFYKAITTYSKSIGFKAIKKETKQHKADLRSVKYSLILIGNAVRVRKYESETDYSEEVSNTFEKFRQGEVKDYRTKYVEYHNMNHVEAKILELVARLHPELFKQLDSFCTKNFNFVDQLISVFEREIQFFLSYLEFIKKLSQAGLKFCYPQVSRNSKVVDVNEGFDLALANKLNNEGATVVCNDFFLKGKERIIVVSGPNQGGKTTFARMFGQLHYLANLGCPIPGKSARLYHFDEIFTHFEKEEEMRNLRGKLQSDLIRIHDILNQATSKSIMLMNEIFTSTTLNDAIFLSKEIMEKIIQLDLICVWVTFIDEISSISEKTVSMVSTVVPEDPATRTFKIVRKAADGLAYALSIAEKHQLTYKQLTARIKP